MLSKMRGKRPPCVNSRATRYAERITVGKVHACVADYKANGSWKKQREQGREGREARTNPEGGEKLTDESRQLKWGRATLRAELCRGDSIFLRRNRILLTGVEEGWYRFVRMIC
jgi:hypothetical protein